MATTWSNPYGSYLGNREALSVLSETPSRLAELVKEIGPSGLKKSYAPGKWTGAQILSHLADCDLAFGFRWRQVVAEPTLVIQPFDQDLWAKQYADLEAQAALDSFCSLRRWNLAWLKVLPAEAFASEATHPERGRVSLKALLEITAGHDLNHLGQFEKLSAKVSAG